MALFEYSGLDARGKKVSGTIEASGRRAAQTRLREQGIFTSDLQEESAPRGLRGRRLRIKGFSRKLPTVALAAATRQTATLLGAGLSLEEALGTVGGQIDHPLLARTLAQVREDVIQGRSLHEALEGKPKIFPPLYVNMVEVGESSGTLDQVLQRLADFLEEQVRMQSRIRAALAYPVLMALIGTGVLFFLVTFVVPKVTRMLEDLDQALPWPTLLLMRSSDFLGDWWWLLGLALAAALYGVHRYGRTERGRYRLDGLLLKLPLIGRLNLLVTTARLSRTLGTLLQSGIPLLNALAIAANLVQNRVLRKVLDDTQVGIREGEGMAAPLRRAGVFPPMVVQMTAVGEKSGELEGMLFQVADAYEHEVDLSITGILSLLEPVMILVMGTIVGFIVMAILLPIFQASQGMG